MMPNTIILIVAAGRGSRAGGDIPKQYVRLGEKHVLSRTIEACMRHPLVGGIITVIHPDDVELYGAATAEFSEKLLPPVMGGKTRQESVFNGLKALESRHPDFVLIHDAARPFVDSLLINRVIEGLVYQDAVLPVIPVTDTVKQIDNNHVTRTVRRSNLFRAQTPQGFTFQLIVELHKRAKLEKNIVFTDDVSLAEWAGMKVLSVEGSAENQKLTTRRDMEMAELVLAGGAARNTETRTGFGFDVHRFEPGDSIMLCGVKIPFDKKLKGHSDADVAMHALTDALYGAIGEGDIGTHFPPGDSQWKGVRSAIFLEHAVGMINERGGKLVNIDLTIVCEQPKISPHREAMRAELGRIMGLEAKRISIKATTTEQLGFTGRGQGIAAQAIASITLPNAREPKDV